VVKHAICGTLLGRTGDWCGRPTAAAVQAAEKWAAKLNGEKKSFCTINIFLNNKKKNYESRNN